MLQKKKNKKRYERRNKKYLSSKKDHTNRIKEMNKTEEQINNILKSFKPINAVINKMKNKCNANKKKKT